MKIIEWVKSHPYMTGAIVIGGALVFVVVGGFAGGGATTTANVETGPSPEEIAAAANIQIANAQAQGVAANATAQREIAKLEHDLGVISVTAARDTAYNTALGSVAEHYLDNRGSVNIAALENPLNQSVTRGASGGFSFGPFKIGGGTSKTGTNQVQQTFTWPSIDEVLGAFSKNSSVVLGSNPPTSQQAQV